MQRFGPCLTSGVSTRLSVLNHRLLLDNRVPVKVILDVICSQHTSYLKVSWRKCVWLLAQLAVMTCTGRRTSVRHSTETFQDTFSLYFVGIDD